MQDYLDLKSFKKQVTIKITMGIDKLKGEWVLDHSENFDNFLKATGKFAGSVVLIC